MIQTPEPGIYHGIPFEDYLQWDGVSNSSMQPALRSMLHYKERPAIEETPAMKLGTLTHAGRFEPEKIDATYVVMPAFEKTVKRDDGSDYDNPKASKKYKELVADFHEKNKDKIVVTTQQFADMCGMVSALATDERATRYLTGGDYEVSILAIDPVTGLRCKGRCDHLHLNGRRIGDLKTTMDASRFEWVIVERSYHRQLAFYADMIEWLGKGTIRECSIVAVENSAPYGVRASHLREEDLDDGREEYRGILNDIAKALKSKKWPGYTSPEKGWVLPIKRNKGDAVSLKIGGDVVSVG